MREQIEREREEEVARLREEVERLRQAQVLPAESGGESQDDEVDGDPYNLMRSIMFEPVWRRPRSTSPDPICREVIGEEAEVQSSQLRASPIMTNGQVSSGSTAGDRAMYSTDSNGLLSPPLESSSLQRVPQDARTALTSTPFSNGHLDLRFIRSNLAQFDLQSPDGKSTTCTPEPSDREGSAAEEQVEGAVPKSSGGKTSFSDREWMWNSCRSNASGWDPSEDSTRYTIH